MGLAEQSVIAVLTFLHIVAAMGWLGGAIFFLSAIGPGVRTFSPPAVLEFLTKVGPRQLRFFGGAASATIIFGLGLLFAAFGTDTSSWPGYIEVGFTLGLIAWLLAIFVTIPTFRKLDKVAHKMMEGPPGPPPPEFPALLKRANMTAVVVVLVLLLTVAFMVSSAVFS